MALLFFHGSEVLGLVGGVGLGLVGSVSLILWLLYSPPKNPLLPSILYAVCAILIGVWFLVFDDTLGFLLTVAIAFPWSLLVVFAATFLNLDGVSFSMPVGALLNAAFIFVLGSFAKRTQDRNEESIEK
jgi:hypothetical protein